MAVIVDNHYGVGRRCRRWEEEMKMRGDFLPSQHYKANEILDFKLDMDNEDTIYRHRASFNTRLQKIDIVGTDLHRIIRGCVEDYFFRRILAKYIVQLDHKEGGLSPPPLT